MLPINDAAHAYFGSHSLQRRALLIVNLLSTKAAAESESVANITLQQNKLTQFRERHHDSEKSLFKQSLITLV